MKKLLLLLDQLQDLVLLLTELSKIRVLNVLCFVEG